jgi:hypothetical protein
MKILACGFAMLLLLAACSEADPSRSEAATAIGDELAGRLAAPLAQVADEATGIDPDLMTNAVDAALDDITLPPGVFRIVSGTHVQSSRDGGYADVSLAIVVVPTDTKSMFCMVVALSSTGELVAEPVPGDPVQRCDDAETVGLVQP